MHPLDAARRFFVRQNLPEGLHLLLALSGGADSTALAIALSELGLFSLSAVHVNHQLRGAESDEDQAFVESLCRSLGMPFRAEAGPLAPGSIKERGIESAARSIRYEILERARVERGADFVVTAHQRNDQAETVLMRLISGRGLAALRAIAPRRERLLRPFLEVTREDIDRFLEDRGIDPRSDRTNHELRFVRNRLRHEILPMLSRMNPRIVDVLASTAEQAREQEAAVCELLSLAGTPWLEQTETSTRLDASALPRSAWLRRRILHDEIRRLDPTGSREISASDLLRIEQSLDALERSSVTRSLEIIRRGKSRILRKCEETSPRRELFEAVLLPGTPLEIPGITTIVRVDRREGRGLELTNASRTRQLFQLDGQSGCFLVRNRRPGDRFHPLGAGSEKKLNEFLIDRKIPAQERDRIPLLLWNDRIVWIGGVELAEPFRVADRDRPMFEVSLIRSDESG